MAVPVIMPRQGQSVETCIIGEWYKKVGETVSIGDVLFSYETDKASFEETAREDGVLLAVFFDEGDEVAVLSNVAVIGKEGESAEAFRPRNAHGGEQAVDSAVVAGSDSPVLQGDGSYSPAQPNQPLRDTMAAGKVKISPRAKAMAVKLGIDLGKITGTGPMQRIIVKDIEAAATATYPGAVPAATATSEGAVSLTAAKSPASGSPAGLAAYGDDSVVKKLSNIRKLIATSMSASLRNSAQLTHHMSADARKIMALRKSFKKKFEAGEISANITINDLVCYAVISALKKFPQVNTHFLGDSMRWFGKVHLGLAVDTPKGLMVPVVRNADDLSLEGLSTQLASVAARCRKGNVDPDLLSPEAASFTVSNLGNYGVEIFTPVINLPQTAILGVCAIVPRPADLGDGVYGFIPMIGLSLTYDHQALDGGEATLFLREIKEQIERLAPACDR